MKMDISYTDHSFIIGRGGNNIKKIMEDTATHIHFPDSNRSNPIEKSNQVSLCGSLDGVEKARHAVRVIYMILLLKFITPNDDSKSLTHIFLLLSPLYYLNSFLLH